MVSTHFKKIKMLMILNERKSQEDFSHIGKKHDREGRGKKDDSNTLSLRNLDNDTPWQLGNLAGKG